MRNSISAWVQLLARFQPVIVTSCINRLRNVHQAVLFHNAAMHGENRLLRTIQRLQEFLETRFIELPNSDEGITLCRWIAGSVYLFKAAESNRGWLGLDDPEVNFPLRDLPDESDAAKCEHARSL